MHRFSSAFAIVLSLLALSPVASAGIAYSLDSYPADQNGWNLSGTITTDGTLGVITAADITSWSWTVSQGASSFTYTSADPGASTSVPNNFTATATQLLIPLGGSSPSELLLIVGITGPSGAYVTWQHDATFSGYYDQVPFTPLWNTVNPSMGGTDPWVIATATVPEPSTFALAGSAGLCGLAYGLARQRRARRIAAEDKPAQRTHPLT